LKRLFGPAEKHAEKRGKNAKFEVLYSEHPRLRQLGVAGLPPPCVRESRS